MATVSDATNIGATKVPMSLLEPNAYINYQRIEDNLAIVRKRCVLHYLLHWREEGLNFQLVFS